MRRSLLWVSAVIITIVCLGLALVYEIADGLAHAGGPNGGSF